MQHMCQCIIPATRHPTSTGLQKTAFPEVQLQEDILDSAQDDC